jgi:RNA polymerase sigma factor (TIGR02999 family)
MSTGAVTVLLKRAQEGHKDALDALLTMVYPELRRLAAGYLRNERPSHTLQPTALVHEVYMRMVEQENLSYENRSHFMGIAARAMRQVLVDHARGRNAAKRGNGVNNIALEDTIEIGSSRSTPILALDDALRALEEADPLKGQLVEMRFFGGLTAEESATVTGLPVTTVRSQLRIAMALLGREMNPEK